MRISRVRFSDSVIARAGYTDRWCDKREEIMRYLKINTLGKGWYDKDEVLLHAAFQLLTDFIEQEKPDKIVDWNANKLHRKAWKEIKSLYGWWKKERPARKSPLEDKRIKQPPLKFEKIPGSDLRIIIVLWKNIGSLSKSGRKKINAIFIG